MIKKEYLGKIIRGIDTKKSRTEGTSGNKNYTVTQMDIDTYGLQDIIDTLLLLEENLPKNAIKIHWTRFGVKITGVKDFSVRKEYIDDLYKIAGWKSSREMLQIAKNAVLRHKAECRTDWLSTNYYDECLAKIEQRGTYPPYWEDDIFHKYMNAVAGNTEPVHERIFSLKLGTSKTFYNYKSKICSVIKRCCPDIENDSDASDNDIMRQFNILSHDLFMEFKGPLNYTLGAGTYTTVGHETGFVWNIETIRNAVILKGPDLKKVICIENKANFVVQNYDPETLYIFTHGYLSPAERNICRQIADLYPHAEYYHWSDMDYGGIVIFNYMKDKVFKNIKPLHMTAKDYTECRIAGLSGYRIAESTFKKLKNLDAGELEDLKIEIIKYRKGYEQEEMLTRRYGLKTINALDT